MVKPNNFPKDYRYMETEMNAFPGTKNSNQAQVASKKTRNLSRNWNQVLEAYKLTRNPISQELS